LKILHVTPSFYPATAYGGPTYSVYELCRGLIRRGCGVRVLTTDANGPLPLNVNTNSPVEISPELWVRYCHRIADVSVSPGLLWHLISAVRWADVVHLMAVYSFPTIPTLFVCKMLRKPLVWSPRGMLQRWEGTRHRKLKRVWETICQFGMPRKTVLHATSAEEANESAHRLSGCKTLVVPNGVEIPQEVIHSRNEDQLRILYLGRLHPKKGIENLLEALRKVNGRLRMNPYLTIAGAGERCYTETLHTRIRDLGLTQHVKMTGHVEGPAKTRMFENADLVIVPSHTENFGLVVAEALAHGVPVITSRGTPWNRVEDIGCGLWVDNDPDSLAEAIERICSMPLQEMGLRGREWMRREFGWDLAASKMVEVYRNLLTTPRIMEYESIAVSRVVDGKR